MHNMSQLTQMNPRDALPHAQWTIVLYTKTDVECDQQLTVVDRLVTTRGHVRRRSAVNSWPTTVACLSHLATVDVLELGRKYYTVIF